MDPVSKSPESTSSCSSLSLSLHVGDLLMVSEKENRGPTTKRLPSWPPRKRLPLLAAFLRPGSLHVRHRAATASSHRLAELALQGECPSRNLV